MDGARQRTQHRTGPGRWTVLPLGPLATYVVTLVAGPYASVAAEHDGIRLGLHAKDSLRAELEAEAADLFEVTRQSFDHYHRLFGVRYPFGEYHQAFVPELNAGAMENPGCVTFRDDHVYRGRATAADRSRRAGVVAHEMAHQWFGNLVSMRWWDDLWLNESFAEYLGHRCCGEATRYEQWTAFGVQRKDWGAVADQRPSTHPVAVSGAADAASALQNFDGISYAKGAAVLRQLVAYLGEDVFSAGLRAYVTRYAFGNADVADLVACWSEAGGVDVAAWAAAWLRTAGMDTLDVVTAGSGLAVEATTADGKPSPRVHTVTVGAVDAAGAVAPVADLAVRGRALLPAVPAGTVLVVPDLADATWAKVRFGRDGWAAVAAALPALRHESALVVVHNALRDGVRDAELDSAAALDLVCTSLPAQASEVLVSALLGWAGQLLAGPYSPVAERAARLARVHAASRAVLAGAEPGTDRQLAAFRLVVSSAADVGPLLAWSEGRELPPGLELDAELAWQVLVRLVALGADPDLVERRLRQDRSAAAAVHAARARASPPTASAKAAAWRLLMQPSDLGVSELHATAEGFFLPGQDELTHPYVARYFAEIGATAAFRQGWVLSRVAGAAFPRLAVSEGTAAIAETALRTDLHEGLRRTLVDGLDDLRRALASLRRTSSPLPPPRREGAAGPRSA